MDLPIIATAARLPCLDLVAKEVGTAIGLRAASVLFAIHLQTLRLVLAGCGEEPSA